MSKSLARVRHALQADGLDPQITETALSRTAQEAAAALGCAVDQIAKSIIFQGLRTEAIHLFITAGGNTVDAAKAGVLAGQDLGKADAIVIRKVTGFAIGGVSPVGHLTPSVAFFDPRLLEFDLIWAAAGTPRHVFGAAPAEVLRISQAQVADFTS